MPIPLYGFLKGDTVGLLLVADEKETIQELSDRLQKSAEIRVVPQSSVRFIHKGMVLKSSLTIAESDLQPLDRFDVQPQ
jgi:hypothetical protein